MGVGELHSLKPNLEVCSLTTLCNQWVSNESAVSNAHNQYTGGDALQWKRTQALESDSLGSKQDPGYSCVNEDNNTCVQKDLYIYVCVYIRVCVCIYIYIMCVCI